MKSPANRVEGSHRRSFSIPGCHAHSPCGNRNYTGHGYILCYLQQNILCTYLGKSSIPQQFVDKIANIAIKVTIITLISTAVAIMSIIRFYKAQKPVISGRKPLPKLIAFKGIVFLNFIQNVGCFGSCVLV